MRGHSASYMSAEITKISRGQTIQTLWKFRPVTANGAKYNSYNSYLLKGFQKKFPETHVFFSWQKSLHYDSITHQPQFQYTPAFRFFKFSLKTHTHTHPHTQFRNHQRKKVCTTNFFDVKQAFDKARRT